MLFCHVRVRIQYDSSKWIQHLLAVRNIDNTISLTSDLDTTKKLSRLTREVTINSWHKRMLNQCGADWQITSKVKDEIDPCFFASLNYLKAKFDGTPQPFFSVTNVSGVSFWHFSGLSSWGRFRVENTRVLGIYKWDLAALQVAFIERWNLPQSNLGVNRRSWLPPPHDSRRWRAH